jgi:hypothetical protein
MANELHVDMAAEFKAAAAQSTPAPTVSTGSIPQPDASDDFEAPDPSFWSDPNEQFGKLFGDDSGQSDKTAPEVAPQKTASDRADKAAAAGILTYKANGKEQALDLSKPEVLEDVKRRLAMADGMNKAFAEQAKTTQKMKAIEAELAEAREYRDSWNKLEDLRYDKSKLLEVLTGQKYEDFIAEEVAKHNIKTMGSDEERSLLAQQEKIKQLEDRLRLGEDKATKEKLAAEKRKQEAEKAEESAKQEWLKTTVEREFFKNVDESMADDVKEMVYQKSILDLKKLRKEYGKLTNKMVEKTFAENSKRLKNFYKDTVDTEVSKVLGDKKQDAAAAAQRASTKNYQPDVENSNLANLPADKLFQAFRFMNSKNK